MGQGKESLEVDSRSIAGLRLASLERDLTPSAELLYWKTLTFDNEIIPWSYILGYDISNEIHLIQIISMLFDPHQLFLD